MRSVLKSDVRRLMPWTTYKLLPSSNSARYAPSWPVMPVMSAVLAISCVPYRRERPQRAGFATQVGKPANPVRRA